MDDAVMEFFAATLQHLHGHTMGSNQEPQQQTQVAATDLGMSSVGRQQEGAEGKVRTAGEMTWVTDAARAGARAAAKAATPPAGQSLGTRSCCGSGVGHRNSCIRAGLMTGVAAGTFSLGANTAPHLSSVPSGVAPYLQGGGDALGGVGDGGCNGGTGPHPVAPSASRAASSLNDQLPLMLRLQRVLEQEQQRRAMECWARGAVEAGVGTKPGSGPRNNDGERTSVPRSKL